MEKIEYHDKHNVLLFLSKFNIFLPDLLGTSWIKDIEFYDKKMY